MTMCGEWTEYTQLICCSQCDEQLVVVHTPVAIMPAFDFTNLI